MSAPDETIEGPFGARQLSDADWKKQTGKMFCLRLKREIEPYSQWSPIHFELVAKYALNRCTDWFYYTDTHYIFGCFEDYILVKLWVANNRLIHTKGELVLE